MRFSCNLLLLYGGLKTTLEYISGNSKVNTLITKRKNSEKDGTVTRLFVLRSDRKNRKNKSGVVA